MNNLQRLLRQLEFQLLLAIATFLLLSWPIISGEDFSLSQLYFYFFGCWVLVPLVFCLFDRRNGS